MGCRHRRTSTLYGLVWLSGCNAINDDGGVWALQGLEPIMLEALDQQRFANELPERALKRREAWG